MKTKLIFSFLFFIALANAQVGINTTTPNAQLEIKSSNETTPANTDGILIPKVNVFPVTNPTLAQQGMMVYLTTTVGTNQPGFYYWDNTVTLWKPVAGTGGTLDNAYDFGGAGAGKTITADAGAVLINGTDGIVSTGTLGSGAIAPSGTGVKMFWNPRKAAFRAGNAFTTSWNDVNIGERSVAFGSNTIASGSNSVALGAGTNASGEISFASGGGTTASGQYSATFGSATAAIAEVSSSFGFRNLAQSFAETVIGVGNTNYTTSLNGATQFREANATDRLLVVGNAIDANNNDNVDPAERSDALVILKNGNTGIGISNPTERVHILGNLRLENGTQAAGRVLTSDATGLASWSIPAVGSGGTLDQAYDFGGAGLGKTITADAGAVLINGTDGFVSTGTLNSGAFAPTGAGDKMFWNPRKGAFRAGNPFGNRWDDFAIGDYSIALGFSTAATGRYSSAFGHFSFANGDISTAFGNSAVANAYCSTAFGTSSVANGYFSTVFGCENTAASYGETVMGIGATNYTPSLNGVVQSSSATTTDRLLVVGNAIDTNANGSYETTERSDALIILKNGLTRLPSTTNTMINAADGKTVVTKEWVQANGSGSLDQAYNFGGAGLGKTITADAGAVLINGTDGLVSIGTIGSGALATTGSGTRMVWNPRKAAFRAGSVSGTQWDNANIGFYSVAFGEGTIASGSNSTAHGISTRASGFGSTVFGNDNDANGLTSTAFGFNTNALGSMSTAFGNSNTASSFGETTLGIGAAPYTPSLNGATQFGVANATDRLLVVGNAIDADGDDYVDFAERSNALVILKNGNTGIGTSIPSRKLHLFTGASGGTPNGSSDFVLESNGAVYQHFLAPSTAETGLLFGSNVGSIRGGVLFNNVNETLQFRTGGNVNRMFITNLGDVGIGTGAPGGQFELSLNEGRKPGSTSWTIVSDKRLKTINGNYTKGLNEIIQLNPVRYNYKNTGERKFEQEILDTEFTGFIAQEVQPLFPDAVKTDADGFLSFNMHSILVASINAFKELDEKNKTLDEKTKKLELENQTLQTKLNSQNEKLNLIIQRLETLERKN